MFSKRLIGLVVLFLAVMLLLALVPVAQANPAAPAETIIVVDSGTDPDDNKGRTCLTHTPCTLRRAIVQASNPATERPVTIKFNIPEDAAEGYNSALDVWELELYPTTDLNVFVRLEEGQITIDGSTQPGGRSNGPKIILIGPKTGNKGGLNIGNSPSGSDDENVIRGLGFQNFLTHIKVNSNRNLIEDNWFGLTSDGQGVFLRNNEPEDGSGSGGVWLSAGVEENRIADNVFLGFDGTAVAVRGDNNLIENNYVGTDAAGKVAAKQTDPELICTKVDWLGGGGFTVEGDRHQIKNNILAGLRQEIFASSTQPDAISVTGDDHLILNNDIGVTKDGQNVGVCGRGIYLHGSPDTVNVEGNRIINPGLSGISINGAQTDVVTLRSNVIKNQFQWKDDDDLNPEPDDAIQLGPSLSDEYRYFNPGRVTRIEGKQVWGTNGIGSPCGNCVVELFLDDKDPITEALQSLAVVTAAADGNWTATLPFELSSSQRIRTTSTTAKFGTIPLKSAGTTTGLSQLYRAEKPCTGGSALAYGVCMPMIKSAN